MLDHPNIVRLFEDIEDDKYYNLLEELFLEENYLQEPTKRERYCKNF